MDDGIAEMTTSPPIPVVDLGSWADGAATDRRRIASELTEACRRVGFVYVVNHGVPADLLEEAFAWSRKLFDLPLEQKMLAPHPQGPSVHRGYSWPGLEKVSQTIYAEGEEYKLAEDRKVSDVKESYEIGSENFVQQPNVWLPDDVLPGFREFTTTFYWRCFDAAKELLRALALGVGLDDEDFFLRFHSGVNNQLRLLHYPPAETERLANNEISRMPAHSDWGTITMLFQDECGGLQVEDPNRPGHFVDATPMKDALIMNVGDLLMRWSNDHLKSTLHRVTLPPLLRYGRVKSPTTTPPRYSIPYFVSPDPTAVVECLPACADAQRPPRYRPITQEEYGRMRSKGQYL
ncbi:putative thymine dioxygenase [Rosellinia necatrix]|uniref:Putative thymine dioxygenase n=1 Tax=Rosellinia necatrix TaxID=77044 RepID=A0A1W2TMH6_ROSNE|nr:putative thymine dioxygenase [Rosellinia necatrix]